MSQKKDLTRIEDLDEFVHEEDPSEEDFGTNFEANLEENLEETPPGEFENSFEESFENSQDDPFGDPLPSESPIEAHERIFGKTGEIPFSSADLALGEGQSQDFSSHETSFEETSFSDNFSARLTEQTFQDFEDNFPENQIPDELDPEEEIIPMPIQDYKAPENFHDLKTFAENSTLTGMASEGNPSFSVLIRNVRFTEDVNDILTMLKELRLISDSEDQMKARLMRGQLLVPRISEFAAILLAHKLRRFDIDIQVGLSDEIHPPKHQEAPEIGLASKSSLFQNQSHSFHFDEPKLDISQIIVAATPGLEGYQVVRYLGVASEHKMLDGHLIQEESSEEIPQHYRELAQKLKAHALKAHSNAVVGLNYQLTPLPSEYGTNSTKYRLTCTGNLVWVNKL